MNYKENMDRDGFLLLGKQLNLNESNWFKKDLLARLDISKDDIVTNMFRNDANYMSLIESEWLNKLVNDTLNDRAIIQDIYGLTNLRNGDQGLTRNKFHRDTPWLPSTRTCILIFISLEDTNQQNGATEIIPFSHFLEKHPSQEYIDNHVQRLNLKTGEVAVIDAALWHKCGNNQTKKPRPMLLLKYSLAFIKQPIDLCKKYESFLNNCSDLVKQRMGWYVTESNWQSGNYTMQNTKLVG